MYSCPSKDKCRAKFKCCVRSEPKCSGIPKPKYFGCDVYTPTNCESTYGKSPQNTIITTSTSGWNCSKCTFYNTTDKNVCYMCHLPKSGNLEDWVCQCQKLNDANITQCEDCEGLRMSYYLSLPLRSGWRCSGCKFVNLSGENCTACQQNKPSAETWECQHCHIHNYLTRTNCLKCNQVQEKPTSALAISKMNSYTETTLQAGDWVCDCGQLNHKTHKDCTKCNESKNKEECVICLDSKSEYAFVECGHKCLCVNCKNHITICPICRINIKLTPIKIY